MPNSARQLSEHLGEKLLYSDKGTIENLDQRISRRQFLSTARNVGIGLAVAYASSRLGIQDVYAHKEKTSPPVGGDEVTYFMPTIFSEKTRSSIDGKYDTTVLDIAKDDSGKDFPLNEWNEIDNVGRFDALPPFSRITYKCGVWGLKETDSTIQGYIDFAEAVNTEISGVSIAIDPLHNAGDFPQEDDYKFSVVKISGGYDTRFFQGTGDPSTKWKLIDQPPSIKVAYSYTSTPNQDQTHFFEEFELDKKELKISSDKFGFGIRASTMGLLNRCSWPIGVVDLENPLNYGDVIALGKPARVPEFPYLKEALVGGSLLLATRVERFLRNRKSQIGQINYKN